VLEESKISRGGKIGIYNTIPFCIRPFPGQSKVVQTDHKTMVLTGK
jgi:hypothetical protein